MADTSNNRTATISILLAADDVVHGALGEILRRFDWQWRHVKTCRAAIAIAIRDTPPIVFCDAQLPDGRWTTILDALADQPTAPNVIVTSRVADEQLWAEVLNLGGSDVLVQPFDPEEVFRVISLVANSAYRMPRHGSTMNATSRMQTPDRRRHGDGLAFRSLGGRVR